MPQLVTDPAVLAQLNGGAPPSAPAPTNYKDTSGVLHITVAPDKSKQVTDPAILAQLNAPEPAAPQADTSPGGWVSQGLSGINEGIAKGAGFPVDAMTWLTNKGTEGVNSLLHTDFPQIEHPVGGSDMIRQLMSPTIAPPSDDPGQKFVRRVGEEVGTMAVPGMGIAAKTAAPLATIGSEVASALAGGSGAAAAQQIAPGNPWAELTAELAGGFTPSTLMNTLKRATVHAAVPTLEELSAAKDAAYKAADQSGVRYSAPAFKDMAVDLVKSALKDNISPTRHPVATSMLKDIAAQADQGFSPSLTQLDQLRQVIRRDVVAPSYTNPNGSADAHFGHMMVDHIDDFINNAGQKSVVSGSGAKGASLIMTARELNTRLRKVEIIHDAIAKAKLQAASAGSGGNINNSIRQAFKSILTSPKKVRSFSAQERADIAALVRQNRMDDLLRYVGKFSPGGNGLMGMVEIGATLAHPGAAVFPAAGFTAKAIADARTVGKAERLAADVARGGPAKAPAKVIPSPAQIAAAKAQLLAGLTNVDAGKPPITSAASAR